MSIYIKISSRSADKCPNRYGKCNIWRIFKPGYVLFFCILFGLNLNAQDTTDAQQIDIKISRFLEEHRNLWHDTNVPESDGRVLHDIIVENRFTRVLEIGTSTGLSSIWMARALVKTGGRLETIEIDRGRYEKALENFESAGVSQYIVAHLADAHDLVKDLKGPYDFIFCDADKVWYMNYFRDLWPKISENGCFAAHNVLNTYFSGIPKFVSLIRHVKDGETEIIRSSFSGISVTCKREPQ